MGIAWRAVATRPLALSSVGHNRTALRAGGNPHRGLLKTLARVVDDGVDLVNPYPSGEAVWDGPSSERVRGTALRPSISPTILQAPAVSTVAGTAAAILSRHCGLVFIWETASLVWRKQAILTNRTFSQNARESNRLQLNPLITTPERL